MAIVMLSMAPHAGYTSEEGESVVVAWAQSVSLLRTAPERMPGLEQYRTVLEYVGHSRRRIF